MPSPSTRRQPLSAGSHPARTAAALLLAVIVFAVSGCTAGVAGHGTRASAGTADKTQLPSSGYDVGVYLCTAISTGSSCSGVDTEQQVATIRSTLLADKTVDNVLFLSTTAAYRLGRQVLPAKDLKYVTPGVLPATFLVRLADPRSQLSTFSTRYRTQAGVDAVKGCTGAKQCALTTLRAADVVH